VYPPLLISNAWTNLHESWYVYHATWSHLNGIHHTSLPSVIPTLQPVKFLRQNLNIAWCASVRIPPIKCQCLNQYLWNLVCISWHLSPSQIWHSLYVFPNILVFCAVRVVSKESRRLVLPRTVCFQWRLLLAMFPLRVVLAVFLISKKCTVFFSDMYLDLQTIKERKHPLDSVIFKFGVGQIG
jgi:hypothetical protein